MASVLTVVVCSLNGAEGVDRCLRALEGQTIRSELDVIVVDDGSTDSTSDVARAHAVTLVRHEECRGVSAARNSGLGLASAPLVAFLDDDCEPDADWAEKVVSNFRSDILGLGGALVVPEHAGIMLSYLGRNNPLDPQELTLAESPRLLFRLWLYLRRQWAKPRSSGRRRVFSVAAGNMAIRRSTILAVDGFDERIRFGGDDDDLWRRLVRYFPGQPLIFDPDVRVTHHFKPSLRDTLRRSRAYGRGGAMMCRKWAGVRPTIFPFPIIVLVALVLALRFPYLVIVAIVLPQIFYPRGLRAAVSDRNPLCLLDPYIQLAQEACGDVGFVQGWFRFRNFASADAISAGAANSAEQTDSGVTSAGIGEL